MKQCSQCHETKPYSEFKKGKGYKDGYRAACRKCLNLAARRWHARKQAEAKSGYAKKGYSPQEAHLQWVKYRFGLSADDYAALARAQDDKCAICGAECSQDGRRLAVDHDHETGAVRGLLCRSCNFGLGWFKDNPRLLERAIAYIEAFANATKQAS